MDTQKGVSAEHYQQVIGELSREIGALKVENVSLKIRINELSNALKQVFDEYDRLKSELLEKAQPCDADGDEGGTAKGENSDDSGK